MESHRHYFWEYFSKKYSLIKCSLSPLKIGDKSFNDFDSAFEYLDNIIKDDDVLFFNDCYWVDHLRALRSRHPHNQLLLRSGGNDLLAAHVGGDNVPLHVRQQEMVSIINETIDYLIINSDYSYYQNIKLGINPRLMKKIRGGVDTKYCEELISQRGINRDHFFNNHNLSKDKAIVTISSRFVPFKGIDKFIKETASLFNSGKYHLLLIGDGTEKDNILSLANKLINKGNFSYLGPLSNQEALKSVSISDVFVNPSIEYQRRVGNEYYIHTETMGRSMMEAIALNIPVVASNVGGTKELFDEYGDIGEIDGDYQSKTIKCLNKQIHIKDKEKLDWEHVFKQYESLIDSWNNKQLVFSVDLDLTLIDSDCSIEEIAPFLKERSNNSVFIINTCRILNEDLLNKIAPLGFDYLIYENGRGIYNYKELVDQSIVTYFDSLFENVINRFEGSIKRTQPNCISIRHYNPQELADIKNLVDGNIAKVVVGPDILKIISCKCNKEATLLYLLKEFPYSQTLICAGDATNDIDMLNIADYSFCSSNIEQFVISKHEVYQKENNKIHLAKRIFNQRRIVVSLTAVKQRLPSLKDVLASLLEQSVEPDLIAIYVDKDSFSSCDFNEQFYRHPKIQIHFVDLDIKAHKKYYYSFQEYPNDYVITVDDDIIYHPDTIKKLMEYHYRYPQAIICNRGRFIFLNDEGVAPYRLWPRNCLINEENSLLMATGCLGVLYQPNQFDSSVFDLEKIMDEDVITNDDIWLKSCELKFGLKVVSTDLEKEIIFAKNTQNSTLLDENIKFERQTNAAKKLFDQEIIKSLKDDLFDITNGQIIYDGHHSTIYRKNGYIVKIIHSPRPNSDREIDKETEISRMKDVNTHRVLGYLKEERKIVFDYLDFVDLPTQLDLEILKLVKEEISKIEYRSLECNDTYLQDLKNTLTIYESVFGKSSYWCLFNDFSDGVSIHGDINFNNIKLVNNKIYIFDFENACYGPRWWDLMYFIADYPYEYVSQEVLDSLSKDDIERMILILQIRIGRLIRKNGDVTLRKKSLDFYLGLLNRK